MNLAAPNNKQLFLNKVVDKIKHYEKSINI
jgi:hypothetical protein